MSMISKHRTAVATVVCVACASAEEWKKQFVREGVHTDAGAPKGVTDKRRILCWSDDKTLRLWDAATGQQIGRNGWATVVVVICFNRARPRPSLFL
jgi:hypothetical protein